MSSGVTNFRYTGADSSNRLKRLQGLCRSVGDDDSKAPDAIMIIPGVDGRHDGRTNNEMATRLVKWLLCGDSGRDVLDSSIGVEDEVLEDVLICVKRTQVELYYSAEAASKVDAVVGGWRNLKKHYVGAGEMGDEEVKELFKMRSFMAMVKGCERVGMTLTPGYNPKKPGVSDQFEVEKWPIVGTYGLADFGMGGYFTMKHKVVDATPLCDAELRRHDSVSLRSAAFVSIPRLLKHWGEFTHHLSSAKRPERRRDFNEAVLGDSIIDFFDFGMIRRVALGHTVSPGRGSVVLLGQRTALEPTTNEATLDSKVCNAGAKGTPALHLVARVEDPSTGIRAARSYFLKSEPSQQSWILATAAGASGGTSVEEGPRGVDANRLQQLYAGLVHAHAQTLRAISEGRSEAAASAMAEEAFESGAKSALKTLPADWTMVALSVAIEWIDSQANTVEEGATDGSNYAVVTTRLGPIPSAEHDGETLGNLVVVDTIVPTPEPQYLKIARGRIEDKPLILTRDVPYFASWAIDGPEEVVVSTLDKAMSTRGGRATLALGDSVGSIHTDATLLTGSYAGGFVDGQVRLFETGFAFIHAGIGPLPVSMVNHVKGLWVLSGDLASKMAGVAKPTDANTATAESWWVHGASAMSGADPAVGGLSTSARTPPDVLVVHMNNAAPRFFPNETSDFIGIVLPEGSSLKTGIVNLVSKWSKEVAFANRASIEDEGGDEEAKESGAVEVEDSKDAGGLPEDLREAYEATAMRKWQWSHDVWGAVESQRLVDAERATQRRLKSTESGYGVGIPVTLIVGAPGGGKSRLARAIVQFTSGEYSWAVVTPGASVGVSFTFAWIKEQLVQALKDLMTAAKSPRVVVSVPGYCDVITAAAGVAAVPGAYVHSCIAAINARNVFADQRMTHLLPRVAEQVTEGWVHAVALIGSEDVSSTVTARIKSIVRVFNPSADFLLLSGGLGRDVVLSMDLVPSLLSGEAYSSLRSVALRHTVAPGWMQADSERAVESVLPVENEAFSALISETVTLRRSKLEAWLASVVRRAPDWVAAAFAGTPEGSVARAAAESEWLVLWRVKGFVRLAEDLNAMFEVDAVPGLCRIRKTETTRDASGRLPPSSLLAIIPGEKSEDIVSRLRDAFLSCRPSCPALAPMRTVSSLSPLEKEEVRRSCMGADLPDGCYFDGRSYVNANGSTSRDHPDIAKFHEEYVNKLNVELSASNAALKERIAGAEAELKGAPLNPDDLWWRDSDEPAISIAKAAEQRKRDEELAAAASMTTLIPTARDPPAVVRHTITPRSATRHSGGGGGGVGGGSGASPSPRRPTREEMAGASESKGSEAL